jgi:ubiquinol-cytochrome c reductase iron-sulfur subunit
MLAAGGALGLIAIFPLRSLGKPLGTGPASPLEHTAWRKGARLVNSRGIPVKIGDIAIGGFETVFPEFDPTTEEAPVSAQTLLIRLRPGEDRPRRGRENWSLDGHVAYSKICTHAGCPVGLYEQQTHHLLCPCHQSTFDVTDGCRPLFGPAARSLPQLAIAVDADGYFIAQGDYNEPVGPSFWERKP